MGRDPAGGALRIVRLVCAGTALTLAAVTSAAACGGSPSRAPGAGRSVAVAWQRVTDCIRRNGMPHWPDPSVGPDGTLGFPADAPRTTSAVQRACAAQFAALPGQPTGSPTPVTSAQLSELVRFAQCVRSHGYPGWPDPGPAGAFPLSVTAIPGAKTVLTQPPRLCRGLIPRGGIHVGS